MAKIERFEDIEVWQKARERTKAIYAMSAATIVLGQGRFNTKTQRRALLLLALSCSTDETEWFGHIETMSS